MNKIITVSALLLTSTSLLAASLKTDNPERKPSAQVIMSEVQSKRVTKLSEFLADEKYAEAKSGLEALLAKTNPKRDAYFQSLLHQLLGHAASAQGDFKATARHFQKSIDLDAMPNATHFSMMLQLAQIKMADQDYQGVLKSLDEYFKVVDEIPDKAFAVKANTHAQLEQYREAQKAIKQAIALADKPNETWYQLLLSTHAELSEYKQMAEVLKILVELSPNKKIYWKQLSSVYFTLKDDKKSLAVLALAEKNGLLSEESEYMQLYKMYSYNNVPFEGAKLLERAMNEKKVEANFKNLKQLGQTWYAAKNIDKSLAAYDRASEFAKDGEMDLTRSFLYLDMENWPKAVSSITSALQKGGLSDDKMGNAWLMLGMSQASLKKYPQARKAFNNAIKYQKSRSNAQQWLNHLSTLEEKAKTSTAQAQP